MSGRYTPRAMLIGTGLALVINIAFPYALLAMRTAGMSSDYITAGAVFLFFLLVGVVNPLLKLCRRSWGLTPAELVIIYVMMILASAIPTWGLTANLIPMLPTLYYYATPENNWAETLHPYVTSWLVPQDERAIQYFFEGLPQGSSIPWDAWAVPLMAWCTFIIAIYLMMIAITVIVRRQWVDHDRLTFPLVQLPMDMAEQGNPGEVVTPFFRNPIMWAGFTIPFLTLSTLGLNHYFPFVPEIEFSHDLFVPRLQQSFQLFVSFTVMGLAYFLSLDVGMSIWLFHLIAMLQMGVENMVGYSLPGRHELFSEGSLTVSHQGMGAMIALVVVGLWTSRGHLKDVWDKAWRGSASPIDDSQEILSYRQAIIVLTLASLFAMVWLSQSGVPLEVTVIFLIVAFCVFYGLARIVAEGGLGFARAQMTAQPVVVNSLGTDVVTSSGIVSLGLTYGWAGDLRTMVMASAINGQKLADSADVRSRMLFWSMLLAIVVGLAASIWVLIWMAYEHGGINLHWWFYNRLGQLVHNDAAHKITNPVGPNIDMDAVGPRYLFTSVGAAVMALLMYLRHRFLWWPVHYLGFPIGATYMIRSTWFSILIGWCAKAMILKYGGIPLYRRLRPFFLGLILGQISCSGMWTVIDFIMGESGNIIYVGMQIS
ncbi:MAG: DUF6785 family protein [Candidatus Latescibacterota bacterium]|nr:DUF6785 family protein [Candidatus Latescibacterota bacterium]